MKKILFILTACGILVIGGLITSYIYFNYTDYITYQNGIFVSKEVDNCNEATSCLYQTL